MTRPDARFGIACAVLCLTWSLLGSAGLGRAERDRPPPAHTGGFSEPLCTACHIQADVNAGPGTIAIAGLPHEYEPNASYTLTITVAQEYLTAGGFQMSARFEDGRQAGSLTAAPSDETRMAVTLHDSVEYIHHVYAGTQTVSPDTARWQVVWTAPPADAHSTGARLEPSSSSGSSLEMSSSNGASASASSSNGSSASASSSNGSSAPVSSSNGSSASVSSSNAPAPGAMSPPGAVIFHIAGNAADDDESPLGDMIYAMSARTVRGK